MGRLRPPVHRPLVETSNIYFLRLSEAAPGGKVENFYSNLKGRGRRQHFGRRIRVVFHSGSPAVVAEFAAASPVALVAWRRGGWIDLAIASSSAANKVIVSFSLFLGLFFDS